MNVTSKISVDMTRQNVGQRVNAVQGDGNTRLVEITLLSGGQPWQPPDGVEAAIAYMQPGGTKGLYNKLADDTAAISISGNVATVIIAPKMLTASGTVQASLVFNDAQLNRLTTFPFSVSVTSNPAAGAQKTEDYIRLQWLEDKLDEYLRKAADSGEFDGAPGHTPEYGVDYGTPEQITGIANQAAGILADDIHKISAGKVDKAEGMGLSSNDYDNAAKAKVDAIPEDPKYTDTVYDDTEVNLGLNQIKKDLATKIDKPATAPEVGKILKVTAVNDDGTFTCEWADAPGGGVTDVTVGETSVVSDGVANIPVAYYDRLGAIVTNGFGITGFGNGKIGIVTGNISDIDKRGPNYAYHPVTYNRIDYAVKAAMCDGKGAAWTDAERIAALLRMGCTVDDNGFVKWTAQEVSE